MFLVKKKCNEAFWGGSRAEQMTETNIQVKHNGVKKPNWPKASQLAIYKRGRGSELGTSVNKSS